ncbi:Uncharacterised protein family (UPF0158) [Gracilibacillus ureilyticus]|uniref:Uncharacterized protein family (UPF0158) n=1 Tax=Gracilibacillus ureilyticus TaxID=531814 RepID=A0A1H9UL37_9BACI|nr:UPF0158 family protein [Gracilibacillus ureilyticus]SES09894.1 Uncharacterised protein family (UPF0158) [Gracilibacillus ureilyticus]
MGAKVKLDEILTSMEMQSSDNIDLLQRKTGNVISVLSEYMTKAEDGEPFDDMYGWEQEQMELAYDILENEENYIELPDEFDIHEYRIIEEFCYTVENEAAKNKLLRAIRGRGAFRRFRDNIEDLDLEQNWYAYRDERYKEIARGFCEKYGLKWVE